MCAVPACVLNRLTTRQPSCRWCSVCVLTCCCLVACRWWCAEAAAHATAARQHIRCQHADRCNASSHPILPCCLAWCARLGVASSLPVKPSSGEQRRRLAQDLCLWACRGAGRLGDLVLPETAADAAAAADAPSSHALNKYKVRCQILRNRSSCWIGLLLGVTCKMQQQQRPERNPLCVR